jgi:hypothetical protein
MFLKAATLSGKLAFIFLFCFFVTSRNLKPWAREKSESQYIQSWPGVPYLAPPRKDVGCPNPQLCAICTSSSLSRATAFITFRAD